MGTRINYEICGADGTVAAVLYSSAHDGAEEDAEKVFRGAAADVLGPTSLIAMLLQARYATDSDDHEKGHRMFFLDIDQQERAKVLRAMFTGEDFVINDVPLDVANAPAPGWLPISQAPKDQGVLMVNDTTEDALVPWTAAKWLEAPDWSGWVYEDDILNDNRPLGPKPTHYLVGIPPVPRLGG